MTTFSVRFTGDFLEIRQLNFFGQYSRSPNGHFILAWQDADPSKGIGGARKEGLGSYLLLSDSQLLLTGNMERPNDGKVADTGTFILNDWVFGDNPNGRFCAFSPAGQVLIKKKFNANLFNNGLSNDGRLAACQTCMSDSKAHSGVLTIFDLERRTIASQFIPVTGQASEYHFDVPGQIIHLIYKDKYRNGEGYGYKLDGTLLDVDAWEKNKALLASGYAVISVAEKRLNSIDASDLTAYSEVIDLFKHALAKGVSEGAQARVHRFLGEVYLRCNQKELAIEHFGQALRLNPKIGLRKIYQSLKGS